MIVHDITCFESRLTVISFNILGTKIYGTLAVGSEFKSGMEDISSDVAKEFAEPFKKEVFINSFFHSSNHSFMHAFIHSSFLSFFLSFFVLSFSCLSSSLTFLNQQFIPISFYIYLPYV